MSLSLFRCSMSSIGCSGFASISNRWPLDSALLRSSIVAGWPDIKTILHRGTISAIWVAASIPVMPPKNTSAIKYVRFPSAGLFNCLLSGVGSFGSKSLLIQYQDLCIHDSHFVINDEDSLVGAHFQFTSGRT